MKIYTILFFLILPVTANAGDCRCSFLGASKKECKNSYSECSTMCNAMNPSGMSPGPSMQYGEGACPTGGAPNTGDSPQLSLSTEPTPDDIDYQNSLSASSVIIKTAPAYNAYYKNPPGQKVTLTVNTGGNQVLGTRVYLKNSSWPYNCIINPANTWVNVGPSSANGIGWSSTSALEINNNSVSVTIGNWSDCNTRGAKLAVFIK